ncbi:MAG TPA: NADH-quinone oxidoreductase subunit C [Planctomycetota bacterium]|nr:NADH-quinone oxidoreductase subunit C [Planctomycetota bacterium]
MNRDQLVKQIDNDLGSKVADVFRRNAKRVYLTVEPENSLAVNRYLFEHGGRLATATGVDCRDWIEVCYHYCFDPLNVVVTVKTRAYKPACELDSVATVFPGANFIEREIQDLLGAKFLNHPDPRRLILADDWPEGVYPLRKDYHHEAHVNTGRAVSPDHGRARVLSALRRG